MNTHQKISTVSFILQLVMAPFLIVTCAIFLATVPDNTPPTIELQEFTNVDMSCDVGSVDELASTIRSLKQLKFVIRYVRYNGPDSFTITAHSPTCLNHPNPMHSLPIGNGGPGPSDVWDGTTPTPDCHLGSLIDSPSNLTISR